MDIDSMVQNSALVRAREGGGSKGRSWRWREMLRFPPVSQCQELASIIERDYYSLCVVQPIGRELFRLFCRSRPDLKNHTKLLEALEEFDTKADEERMEFGVSIIQRFLQPEGVSSLAPLQQSCSLSLQLQPCADVFQPCREALHRVLSGEPFSLYQNTVFFQRFLQWKMLERQPVTKQNFRQYRLLGKGGFGEVWACQVRATGMMYACKKLEKTHVKKRRGEGLALNEKQILEGLDSRFVVSLAYAYETKHALCMVLTMMSGGDLKFHIYDMGGAGLPPPRVCFYGAQLSCGLTHLHQRGILYRDLKPENILLDEHGHVRISDLGLAVRLKDGELARGRVGTLGYMAPEVLSGGRYGRSADWWGLGCLIYEMTAGRPPFRRRKEHLKPPEMERRISNGEPEYCQKFSKMAKDICTWLLTKDPQKRLGSLGSGGSEVKSHPFFQQINFRMLEAGLVEPPFKPDPRLVYCSDVQDIDEFSSVKGVVLTQTDAQFHRLFNTGSVPIAWQNELISTGCFAELNTFSSEDLEAPPSPRRGLLHRIFRRHQHSPPRQQNSNPDLHQETRPGGGHSPGGGHASGGGHSSGGGHAGPDELRTAL